MEILWIAAAGTLLVGLLWWRRWILARRTLPALPSHSLRIGTFNTHLDSLIFAIGKDPLDFLRHPSAFAERHAETIRAQADAIASSILGGGYDYDILALNEVFSEDARAVLIDRLSGAYPHFIGKLPLAERPIPFRLIVKVIDFFGDAAPVFEAFFGDIPTLNMEDSGLMLFSRFPIEKTAFAPFAFSEDERVAAFPDSFAQKGVGYARIRDSRSGRPYHVLLTHLQENQAKWAWVRTAELHQIREFISSLDIDLAADDVFMMGDLNLNGLWTNLDLPPKPQTIEDLVPSPSSPEWKQHFGDPASFFASPMHDTWFRETSRRDAGGTAMVSGERIDYILRNDAFTPNRPALRVQHLTLAYNLYDADGNSRSDHFGVNADLNLGAPHCTPRDAFVLSSFDTTIAGKIAHPGSMVWYRIDVPGTYSFAIDSGVELELYESTNLSLPILQYQDETTVMKDERGHERIGRKFVLPEAPYYVRVFEEDRTGVGSYALLVHRHQGIDANDAIVLDAWLPAGHAMPVGKPLNADDAMWFQLQTERADSGKPQDLQFRLTDVSGNITRFEIRADDEKTMLAAADPSSSIARKDVGPSKLYALVKREDVSFGAGAFTIEWRTNLTILYGNDAQKLMLICDNETNPEAGGPDQMAIRVWVDGALRVASYVGEFEEGHSLTLTSLFPENGLRYLEKIELQFIEKDADDDESEVFSIPVLTGYRDRPQTTAEFDGGRYLFRFNLAHRIQA